MSALVAGSTSHHAFEQFLRSFSHSTKSDSECDMMSRHGLLSRSFCARLHSGCRITPSRSHVPTNALCGSVVSQNMSRRRYVSNALRNRRGQNVAHFQIVESRNGLKGDLGSPGLGSRHSWRTESLEKGGGGVQVTEEEREESGVEAGKNSSHPGDGTSDEKDGERIVHEPVPSSEVGLAEGGNNSKVTAKADGLSTLDAYFAKLKGNAEVERGSGDTINAVSGVSTSQGEESAALKKESNPKNKGERKEKKTTRDFTALKALDAYFEKLNPPAADAPKDKSTTQTIAQDSTATSVQKDEKIKITDDGTKKTSDKSGDALSEDEELQQDQVEEMIRRILKQKEDEDGKNYEMEVKVIRMKQDKFQEWLTKRGEESEINVLSTLLALNAGVFLFELASPEAVPGQLVTSLPALFMAKVNDLIIAGDWWRLITPMFLHSGFFHIIAGTVALSIVGPAVEAAFGPWGFLSVYIVGGLFGNLFSFLQTPEVTVGGTGPLYGIAAAFVVYLLRNRDAVGPEQADEVMGRLLFFGALNLTIGDFLPIDDWTHIGAAIGGALYGLLAAPKVVKVTEDGKPTGSFISEEPDQKQLAWIFLLCVGIFVALYQTGMPLDLLSSKDSDVSSLL